MLIEQIDAYGMPLLHEAASISEIKQIAQQYINEFFPSLEMPDFKVVNQLRAGWNGKAVMKAGVINGVKSGMKRPEICIQKAVTHDPQSLERIIAHELIHCFEYQEEDWYVKFFNSEARDQKIMARYQPDGHGEFFMKQAARINAVKGADWVTKTSDENIQVQHDDRNFFVLIELKKDGNFSIGSFMKKTAGIKKEIERVFTDGRSVKLFKVNDMKLLMPKSLGAFGEGRYKVDGDIKAKVEQLWNSEGMDITTFVMESFCECCQVEGLSEDAKSDIDKMATEIGGYLNCRLFVQQLTGISNIEAQPQVKKPEVGDILWWGTKQGYRHVAVFAGNGMVWQVEEWGASPEKKKLSEVIDYWDKPNKIFKGGLKKIEEQEIKKSAVFFFGREGINDFQHSYKGSDKDALKIGEHRSGHAYTTLNHRIKFYIERHGEPDFIHVISKKDSLALSAVYAEKGKDMIQLWSFVNIKQEPSWKAFEKQAHDSGYNIMRFSKGSVERSRGYWLGEASNSSKLLKSKAYYNSYAKDNKSGIMGELWKTKHRQDISLKKLKQIQSEQKEPLVLTCSSELSKVLESLFLMENAEYLFKTAVNNYQMPDNLKKAYLQWIGTTGSVEPSRVEWYRKSLKVETDLYGDKSSVVNVRVKLQSGFKEFPVRVVFQLVFTEYQPTGFLYFKDIGPKDEMEKKYNVQMTSEQLVTPASMPIGGGPKKMYEGDFDYEFTNWVDKDKNLDEEFKIDKSIEAYEKRLGKPIATKKFREYILKAYGNPKGKTDYRILADYNGQVVGSIDPWTPLMIKGKWGHNDENNIAIPNAFVQDDHQRKGLATALYDFAEKLSGGKAVPWSYVDGGEEPMSSMGKAFWSSRGYDLEDEEEDEEEDIEEAKQPKDKKYNASVKGAFDFLTKQKTFIGKVDESVASSFEEGWKQYEDNFASGEYRGYLKPDPILYKELKEKYAWPKSQYIYRAIRAEDVESIRLNEMGIYWTNNKDMASPYWGDPKLNLYRISAKAKESDIDWLATIEANMKMVYGGEEEVTLLEGANLELIGIEVWDDGYKSLNVNAKMITASVESLEEGSNKLKYIIPMSETQGDIENASAPMAEFILAIKGIKHPRVKRIKIAAYYDFRKSKSEAVDVLFVFNNGKESVYHFDLDEKGQYYWMDFGIIQELGTNLKDAIDAIKIMLDEEMPHLVFGKKKVSEAKGDWKKEGYKIYVDEDPVSYEGADDGQAEAFYTENEHLRPHDFRAIDADGNSAGEARIGPTKDNKNIYVLDINIEDEHKRKGLATAIYQKAEKFFKKKLKKGVSGLSKEGSALWSQPNRPFGEAKGDWKKEGYEIKYIGDFTEAGKFVDSTPHTFMQLFPSNLSNRSVYALKDGVIVGYIQLAKVDDKLVSIDTRVDADHQQKGLASAMYQEAERQTGMKFKPSDNQTEIAKKMWADPKRQFGEAENKTHLTAITRTKPSAPMNLLSDRGLMKGKILDYGSGKGFDANHFKTDQYDPHYAPTEVKGPYDTITCIYVLNVIESKSEIQDILNKVDSLLKKTGKAYFAVRRDEFKVGYSSKGTYQDYIYLNLPSIAKNRSFEIYEMSKGDSKNALKKVKNERWDYYGIPVSEGEKK